MIAMRMGNCVAAIGFAGLLAMLLLFGLGTPLPAAAQGRMTTPTAAAATITATLPLAAPRNEPATTTAPTVTTTTRPLLGYLTFSPNEQAATGNFQLTLTGLPAAPTGSRYNLQLIAPATATVQLGPFDVTAGEVDFAGSTDRNLLALYTEAQITLITADDEASPTAPVLLTATLPTTVATALHPLLALGATAPITGDEGINGTLTAAYGQVAIAVQHTGFLRDALSTDDMAQARRHSEHIINTLDGENGFMFGDLDRDGRPENPGDGVGVRVYLGAALAQAATLPAALGSTSAVSATILPTIEDGQNLIEGIFDKALQIFAADTITEANGFAADLNRLVDQLGAQINQAHASTLQLAAYPFYGPLLIELTDTVTTPVASISITPTSTLAPTQRPTATRRALAPTSTPTSTAASGVHIHTLQPTATITGSITATNTATKRPTVAPTPVRSPTPTPTPSPLPTLAPLPTVESSALSSPVPGQRWQDPVDGAVYVYVPGGSFAMGSTAAEAISPREAPAHEVTLDGFWMQQTETTNAQYARCVAAAACTAPNNERWDDPAYADHGVSDVSWAQANAYARWAGGRLPTEAEWERSCRSDDGRTYPWGNEAPDDTRSNYNNAVGDTTPVGSYPAGQSAYGLLDLSGNLWEWTSSLETDYPYDATDGREATDSDANRAVRGGSFYYTSYQIRCAARTGFAPTAADEHTGFRLVLDEPTIVYRNEKDGAVYVYVPGGSFAMGSTAAEAISPREAPAHEVTLDGFWMQQTETTNAQYARCVAATACTAPNNERWDDPAYADHGVSDVSWAQANAYARWAGGRLPTEAEWERSCRSDDGRTYPWGNEAPDDTRSNYNNAVGDTTPVGSYPAGQSAYGLLDLSGNLWEWTSSLETDYPYDATDGREATDSDANRAVRGGSFYYTSYQIRCAARTGFAPTAADEHTGFRLVLQLPRAQAEN